jgi:uncharacterized protein YcfL
VKKSLYFLFVLLTLAALMLTGCATSEEATSTEAETVVEEPVVDEPVVEEPAAEVALKVTGMVTNEMAWSEDEVKAMESMTVQSTNKDGVVSDYTGVDLNTLLGLAGVATDATTVAFVADDGSSAEVTLAEVQACNDCIVSFRNQGGFSTVLPGFSSKLQVKGVVEIQVK